MSLKSSDREIGMKTKFFLERGNFGRYVDVHMGIEDERGNLSRAQPVVFEVVKDGDAVTGQPMLKLRPNEAQTLMDELWTVGLRPTQGQQSEGQMTATTRHLNDMRAIVATVAKVQLP